VAVGTQLGPYLIEGVLGAGGMGQVYRARDTRLGRPVALKVCKEEFSERFEREARMVASLNHPNICTVHDVGPNYLVMELVEGPSLAERIQQGPIPVDEALAIARQIADALDAAHERGVIHRDLKPGNIKISTDGAVKVLDFGLARRHFAESADGKLEDSPTLSMPMTSAGMILGTAAYMSPEQARGKIVDKRADIWAFGVVLYEMLTSHPLFASDTVTDTLAAILTKEPDWTPIPVSIRPLLKACIEKNPKQRLRDIGDVPRLLELQPPAPAAPARRSKLPWTVAAVSTIITLVAVSFLVVWGRKSIPKTSPQPVVRLNVDLGADVSLDALTGPDVILSPDGTRIAYISHARLFTRRLDRSESQELAGTERGLIPFFSPDGRWIAFLGGGKLRKIPVEGGTSIPLCDASSPVGGAWAEDDSIISPLAETGPLLRISPDGKAVPLTNLDQNRGEVTHRWPQVLPGGKAVLFTAATSTRGAFDDATIQVVRMADRHQKTIYRGGTFARYVGPPEGVGNLLYVSHGTLFSAPFDMDKLELGGTPSALIDHVAYSSYNGYSRYDVSRTGALVYRSGTGGDLRTIEWVEQDDTRHPLISRPDAYGFLRLSRDGKRLAFNTTDVWVYDLQLETTTRLTANALDANDSVWSNDGQFLIFSVGGSMLWASSSGGGKPQPIFADSSRRYPWSVTRDGKLLFNEVSARDHSVWVAPVESDGNRLQAGTPLPLGFDGNNGESSPDGRWLAYVVQGPGSQQVYVRSFDGRASPAAKVVSIGNGGGPVWSMTRRELFFKRDNYIVVAPYSVHGDSLVFEKPRVWSNVRLASGPNRSRMFDMDPNGNRAVAVIPVQSDEERKTQNHIVYVENLFSEPGRRLASH
jgi:serine/threonine protein kinase/Tol biopolymer transport system component